MPLTEISNAVDGGHLLVAP